jgi:hypothetical protein
MSGSVVSFVHIALTLTIAGRAAVRVLIVWGVRRTD